MDPLESFKKKQEMFDRNRDIIKQLPAHFAIRDNRFLEDLANELGFSFEDMVMYFLEEIYYDVIPQGRSRIKQVFPFKIVSRTANFMPRHLEMIEELVKKNNLSFKNTVMSLMDLIFRNIHGTNGIKKTQLN